MKLSNTYLGSLVLERGLFFLMAAIKITIIIVRLDSTAYVEYVSLLGITTLVATVSRLGIEIYIKLEIPHLINRLSQTQLVKYLLRLCFIPITSVLIFSFVFSFLIDILNLFPSLFWFQIFAIVVLLSLTGLLYEILISIEESRILIGSQIVSSLLSISIYYLFIPASALLSQFIPIFIIVNMLTVIIYLISTTITINANSITKREKQLPQFRILSIIQKIGLSFLLLSSTLITRLLPVSIIQLVNHQAIGSIALLVTIIDVIHVFFNQGTNYILLNSPGSEKSIKLPNYLINGFFLFSLTGAIMSFIVVNIQLIQDIVLRYLPSYGNYLLILIVILLYPKIVLLLSSSINEGYLIKIGDIKKLIYTRVFSSIFTILLIILFLIEFIDFPPMFIISIILISEISISVLSTFLISKMVKTNELAKYLISQSLPILISILYASKFNLQIF